MKNCELDFTYEEVLAKAPNYLKKKIEHSVDLLRKAEKLALRYDAEDGFFLAFSGGKDSQVLYHIAKIAGVRFKAHMNLTSVDPPQVIRFVKAHYPDVIRHAPKKSIFQLAVDRGLLPSMRIRWCCADLKETAGAGKVTLIGIRKSESSRRARRHEVEVSSKKFSGNLEQFAEWQEKELEHREGVLLRRLKREKKKVNEDEFSLMKENEVRCINGKDSILVSPVFEWDDGDVWEFLDNVLGVAHCELYDNGYHRIGCILCPMSQYKQKVREMEDFPHVKRNWIKAIKAIRDGGGTTERLLQTDIFGGTYRNKERREMSTECSRIGDEVGANRQMEERMDNRHWGTRNSEFRKTWHRKANTGLWAGFLQAPL